MALEGVYSWMGAGLNLSQIGGASVRGGHLGLGPCRLQGSPRLGVLQWPRGCGWGASRWSVEGIVRVFPCDH